jgi:hypothetical protein
MTKDRRLKASSGTKQLGTVDQAWLSEVERRYERHVAGAGKLHSSKALLDELRERQRAKTFAHRNNPAA